jgi:hypothetical protein
MKSFRKRPLGRRAHKRCLLEANVRRQYRGLAVLMTLASLETMAVFLRMITRTLNAVFVGICNMLSVPVSVSIHDPHPSQPPLF